MPKRFHLALITNFTPDEWQGPFGGGGRPWDGQFYVDVARSLERACFDYMIIEDKLMVPESYGGSRQAALARAMEVPKHDPAPLATAIGVATSHIGVVPTLSTLAYPPFMLARLCSTMDSLMGGRLGWNIVNSAEDLAAQNFGLDRLPPHELRYDRADEYVELVRQLFDSWEADAVVVDRRNGIYADHTKVRPVNFDGKFFKCRGPLNTAPSPQHRPAFVQAGASSRGRRFAARHADSIIAIATGPTGMKQFRDDVRACARECGRNPDDIKVLFCVTPMLGETEEEARDKYQRMISSPEFVLDMLIQTSAITEIDFSKFPLDEPLPSRLETNGERGSLEKLQQFGSGKTLRQLVMDGAGGLVSSVELVGTPDQVADKMGQVMEEVGGDGFLITTPLLRLSRRFIAEVTDGLVPALQRRGLTRTAYTQQTLRRHLLEF
jgi:FMN-dependent oxidoreductase (nitrilotriacetate monooxygenase family)